MGRSTVRPKGWLAAAHVPPVRRTGAARRSSRDRGHLCARCKRRALHPEPLSARLAAADQGLGRSAGRVIGRPPAGPFGNGGANSRRGEKIGFFRGFARPLTEIRDYFATLFPCIRSQKCHRLVFLGFRRPGKRAKNVAGRRGLC